ncbi:MAG: hypothetical protein GEU71_07150 [Actinobacteria bacterium]|nr:hypothetical protein [Actinomycetota bacterium]
MKVLFATDGSKPAQNAGTLLRKIGRHSLDLTVLGVSTFEIVVPESPTLVLDSIEERKAHAQKVIDEEVALFLDAGFSAEGLLVEGSAGEQIVEAVEGHGYDLTVVGAGRRSWLSNLLLGSASTFVLHNSPSSVLVTHKASAADGPGKVLLAVDGSEGSQMALDAVAGLVDPERAMVHVLSVVEVQPPDYLGLPGLAPPTDKGHSQLHEELIRRSEAYVNAAAATLATAGFSADTDVVTGSPNDRILGIAEKGDFDLVAVGSRGLGPIRRALVGSVSDQVARYSRATLVARGK